MRQRWVALVPAMLAVGLLPGAGRAQEKDDIFKLMAKMSEPGPEHKLLEPMIGEWTFTSKFWLDPAGKPMEGKGKAVRKWMLGGRFYSDEVQDEGMAFQGFGLAGYDKTAKKYTSAWVDSMTTSIGMATGTADKEGKVFTFDREDVDPTSGKKIKGKDVIKIEGKDRHTMEMYKVLDSKEIKVMEIVFVRKK